MDVFEAVRTVLAVRRYQEKPIPAELVWRIVEAGRLTGSSINLQPWHFVVVEEPDTLRRVGELVRTGRYAAGAAMAIVVAIEHDSEYAVSDASRAIQSMILTAWDEGIGSNWTGFMDMEEVKDLLGVPPDMDLLAVLAFGYPDQRLGRGKKMRKPLGEVASRERFGRPFE
jgi:nitroreductase